LHPFILYIILYPLWGSLVTLSKYIHMRSSFEEFIETNLMVQSEFNLVSWFVSYNIFFIVQQVGPALDTPLSPALSRARREPAELDSGATLRSPLTPNMPDGVCLQATIEDPVQHVWSAIRSHVCLPDVGSGPGASSLMPLP
jgi:hypothetical protein